MKAIILLSSYSSGSTFVQKVFSRNEQVSVITKADIPVEQVEFGFFNWAARYIKFPDKSIAYDPVRVMNPSNGQLNTVLYDNYGNYLGNGVNETIEHHFIASHLIPYVGSISLFTNRYQNVLNGWTKIVEKYGPIVFAKQPKYIHDATGETLDLLLRIYNDTKSHVDYRFIFLIRNPLDVLASQIERNFRNDELFRDMTEDRYIDYMKDGIYYAYKRMLDFYMNIYTGDKLIVKYEDILEDPDEVFSKTFDYCGLCYNGEGNITLKRSYARYLLSKHARQEVYKELGNLARRLGYEVGSSNRFDVLKQYYYRTRDEFTKDYSKLVNNPRKVMLLGKIVDKLLRRLRS